MAATGAVQLTDVTDLPPIPSRPRSDGLPPIAPRTPRGDGPLPDLTPRPAASTAPLGVATADASTAPGPPPRRRVRMNGAVVGLVAVALVAGAGAGATAAWVLDDDPPAAPAPTPTTTPVSVSTDADLADLVARTAPSVVQVITDAGEGSGVIIAPSGLIATNKHVVGDSARATIVTADNRRVPATVVQEDPRVDLAILRPSGVVGGGVTLADEPDGGLRQGDRVFAVGSPFGLRNTVTAGVVSALGRNTGGGAPMIQIDAPINPGNSGGGLFDMRGRLVGVPTSIYGPIRGNVGIGFAVPVSRVQTLIDRVP